MNHTTPQIFATKYIVDFEEDAKAYKALYDKAEAELRAQKEINISLANENARLRAQIGHLENKFCPSWENVYADGSPPLQYGELFHGTGILGNISGLRHDVFYDGSPLPKDFNGFVSG